jgi:hypothetical protein
MSADRKEALTAKDAEDAEIEKKHLPRRHGDTEKNQK